MDCRPKKGEPIWRKYPIQHVITSYSIHYTKLYETKPDSSYYDFLTNDLINNPLAVMLPDYYFFINRIKYSEIFRGQPKGFTTSEIMDELKKSGYEFKPEELELAEKMKEAESPEVTKIQQEFQDKYGEQMRNFHQKYGDKLMRLYGERKTSVIAHDRNNFV